MSKLALSSPGCNLAKADWAAGDDQSGRTQRLFIPRDHEPWLLGWHLHFALDRETGMSVPLTAVGEATVRALRLNDPLRVFARKLQMLAELIG